MAKGKELRYEIVERREPTHESRLHGNEWQDLDNVDVRWYHKDGTPFGNFKDIPYKEPDEEGNLVSKSKRIELPGRDFIQDQFQVPCGADMSLVAMMCEEKRKRIEESGIWG